MPAGYPGQRVKGSLFTDGIAFSAELAGFAEQSFGQAVPGGKEPGKALRAWFNARVGIVSHACVGNGQVGAAAAHCTDGHFPGHVGNDVLKLVVQLRVGLVAGGVMGHELASGPQTSRPVSVEEAKLCCGPVAVAVMLEALAL